MLRLLLNWLVNAITLLLIAHFLHGFYVSGLVPALIAALVIGLLNATLGMVLKFFTFPLSIITFGLFLLVINALMIEMATWFVPGFYVRGFLAAFIAAVILAIVQLFFKESKKQ
jgi:putative membrane protein